jgi:predicted acylesterase/phospholipase RssA
LTAATGDASSRVGLALAGGGPEGAVYEIGVLRALDEALDGVDFTRLPVYVGVSAGAFLAANLSNRITTAQNVRAIVKHEPGEHPFTPQTFFTPAIGELFRRSLMTPALLAEAVWEYARHPYDLSFLDSLTRLSRALPVGLFDNEPIRVYLEKIYGLKGRSDDFRELPTRLFVVATELDSGRAVRFGDDGFDHVPISRAVQASSALPGLYPPVVIGDRHYVDGVLLKTMHASVALEQGVELVLCINPIVPVDTLRADMARQRRSLTSLGLPTVLSQTFRTLIHSRMTVGMAAYAPRFPSQDIVLFEPQPDDYRMFFTNIFSFSSRRAVCEYAYEATRRDLLRRHDELAPIFRRHGITLRKDVLVDPTCNIWHGVGLDAAGGGQARDLPVAAALTRELDRLEAWLASRPAAPPSREGRARKRTGERTSGRNRTDTAGR